MKDILRAVIVGVFCGLTLFAFERTFLHTQIEAKEASERTLSSVLLHSALERSILDSTKAFIYRVNPNVRPAVADSIAFWALYWSKYYGVPLWSLVSIIAAESEFVPDAKGKALEIGLCQIHPKTAQLFLKEMKKNPKDFSRAQLERIDLNIRLGAYHLWRSNFFSAIEYSQYNRAKKYRRFVFERIVAAGQ